MVENQNLKNKIAAMEQNAQMKNKLTSTEERHIMENHGCHQNIITDREERFKSKLLEELHWKDNQTNMNGKLCKKIINTLNKNFVNSN